MAKSSRNGVMAKPDWPFVIVTNPELNSWEKHLLV
jgi:hypothetical protein